MDENAAMNNTRLPQNYISRYMWHETQMRGSQHLHDFIWADQHTQDFPEPCPEPSCLSDNAVNMLEDPIHDLLHLPDLLSEHSDDE